jgi:UDP-2,3-diacylglucosamine hydrolase
MSDRLGLIAGSGRLPFEVAEAARRKGIPFSVVAIEDNTDPAIEKVPADALRWVAAGELGLLIEFLKGSGATQVILAGAVSRRIALRDPARLRLDARAIALLGRLRDRGDDALLRAIAGEIESEGMRVVDSTLYLEDRLTPAHALTPGAVPAELQRDLALGLRVAKSLGALDVGQTVVVKDGAVLALEAIEGTDAAIRRGAQLGGPGAIIFKASKPNQDLRFDVPAIGPGTVELAGELGIAAIGLEAGRTLILERERSLELAALRGIAIVGVAAEPVR